MAREQFGWWNSVKSFEFLVLSFELSALRWLSKVGKPEDLSGVNHPG
jgi:hypothetical protein